MNKLLVAEQFSCSMMCLMSRNMKTLPHNPFWIRVVTTILITAFLVNCTSRVDKEREVAITTTVEHMVLPIYAVDIVCNPAEDNFEFTPLYFFEVQKGSEAKDINNKPNNLAIAITKRPELEQLRGKHYGIFLNGELISERKYHFACKLKDTQIEVSIDYNRAQTPVSNQYWCDGDIPREYQEYARIVANKYGKPACLHVDNGGMAILRNGNRIAYFEYDKTDSNPRKLVFHDAQLRGCYTTSEVCDSVTLDELIKTPIFSKTILIRQHSK